MEKKKRKKTAKNYHNVNEIRITNINPKLLEEVNNIVAHLGTTKTGFLKTKIKEMVYAYPAYMREAPKQND